MDGQKSKIRDACFDDLVEDISQEELVILKRQQNRLHLVPEKFDTV